MNKKNKVLNNLALGQSQKEASRGIFSQQYTSKLIRQNTAGFRDALLEKLKEKGVDPELYAKTMLDGIEKASYVDKAGGVQVDYKAKLAYLKHLGEIQGVEAPIEVQNDNTLFLFQLIGDGENGSRDQIDAESDFSGASDIRSEVLENQDEGVGSGGAREIEAEFKPVENGGRSGGSTEADGDGKEVSSEKPPVRGIDLHSEPLLSQSIEAEGSERAHGDSSGGSDEEDLSDESDLLREFTQGD